MADIKQEEFKFPDEKSEDKKIDVVVEGEAEIEVVDDTPEPDRDRTPMKEPPSEVTDDELAQYSEGVKKRIQHFSKGYHEERRAKEAALREREEALRLAQQVIEENKRLHSSQGQTQKVLLDQAKVVVSKELDDAKRKYKEAYESGDADALVEAQETLTAAKIKLERVNNFKPAPLQPQQSAVQIPQPQQKAPIDPKVADWHETNQWFGKDQEMTALALAVHQKLVDSGVSTNSDEYFERINARMRQVFPDAFSSEKASKRSSVVAPATRSTAPRKVVLTQSQVNIAKRLGVPLEVYARKVAEEQRK